MSTKILLIFNDQLKCHNLCSKYPLFSLTQNVDLQVSHDQTPRSNRMTKSQTP